MWQRMTLRAHDGLRQWTLLESQVYQGFSVLVAEPETVDEFMRAVRAYWPDAAWLDDAATPDEIREAGADGPWCLIDLVGRTVLTGGGLELPGGCGVYDIYDAWEPADGGVPPDPTERPAESDAVVWLDTPSDWVVGLGDEAGWEQLDRRAVAATPRNRTDLRQVLYGPPLLGYLADRVLSSAAQADLSDATCIARLTRSIHADWMLQVREELGGRSPRDVLLEHRECLDREIQRRANYWSAVQLPPPALPKDSVAYRFGGFGTVEIVLYFDLIRSLLQAAWARVAQQPQCAAAALREHLAQLRVEFLQSPWEDPSDQLMHGEAIDLERQRMPMLASGHTIDDDCPLCRAAREGLFGLGFYMVDGHHLELENEFAFSLADSREEWEIEQRSFEEQSRRMDRELRRQTAGPLAATEEEEDAGEEDLIWRACHVSWEAVATGEMPRQLAKTVLGFPLAELIQDLRQQPGGQPQVDALNDAFVEFCRTEEGYAAQPAANRLRAHLEATARQYPNLTAKSADLQSRLDEVLRSLR